MSLSDIKALTFDTGGTILDWHTGIRDALSNLGDEYGITGDWAEAANEFRRRSLKGMLNHGEHTPATKTFDDVHRETLDEILTDFGLDRVSDAQRKAIWWDTIHNLECWPDFPGVLPKLREKFICASFTILSVRIITDTARRNGLSWDAVISCQMIGKYKVLPQAYETCASYLQLDPSEILMVACHNFDLNAARASGFKTAFVRRPDEWGPAGSPDPNPHDDCDIKADTFNDLARALGIDA